jgi:hypothetical protein
MSSVRSLLSMPSTLSAAELSDSLRTALIEVGENAYFVFVEPCEPDAFAALVAEVGADTAAVSRAWLLATVDFDGTSEGGMELALPEELGSWLVTSLVGMAEDEVLSEAQLFDGVGEFANMVCGAWLSKLGDEGLFKLQAPRVTRMPAAWAPLAERTSGASSGRTVTLNNMPMRIAVRA